MMEVGWRLREDAWGRGYAKEAATASLALAFDHFGADEVIALTVQGNAGSWGLMLRLGMERRGDLDFDSTDFGSEDPRIIAHGITLDQWRAAA
jgi:RimJ/RimL family protein N-acetyltransferase